MQIGIFGLTNSGKTTVFNALTKSEAEVHAYSSGLVEPNMGTVKVPDERLWKLSEIYHPKKTTPAEVVYMDVPGLTKGMGSKSDSQAQSQLFAHLRNSDALLHVVRAFADDDIVHPDDTIDPFRDVGTAEVEFILADLAIIEKRLERIEKDSKKIFGDQRDKIVREKALLENFKQALEDEQPIRSLEFSEDDEKLIRGYQFLTQKPQLILLNISEDQLEPSEAMLAQLRDKVAAEKVVFGAICGKLEMELAQMSGDDAALFMEDLGITEPGLNKVIRLSYELLDWQSFFTVGEDEVRAWTIKKGTPAVQAAGVIHSDLERGFIRAEVISYDDHLKYGTFAEARKHGAIRLEGKTYELADGDIMHVRFNV